MTSVRRARRVQPAGISCTHNISTNRLNLSSRHVPRNDRHERGEEMYASRKNISIHSAKLTAIISVYEWWSGIG